MKQETTHAGETLEQLSGQDALTFIRESLDANPRLKEMRRATSGDVSHFLPDEESSRYFHSPADDKLLTELTYLYVPQSAIDTMAQKIGISLETNLEKSNEENTVLKAVALVMKARETGKTAQLAEFIKEQLSDVLSGAQSAQPILVHPNVATFAETQR